MVGSRLKISVEMERKEPESVGDVLRSLLEESSLKARMEELDAIELWPQVAGESIASECSRPSVKNGVMSISVKNAALRNELHMSRTSLRSLINNHLGKEIISEIRFVS